MSDRGGATMNEVKCRDIKVITDMRMEGIEEGFCFYKRKVSDLVTRFENICDQLIIKLE